MSKDYGSVFIGGISKVNGGDDFRWADYTQFNMDNWANDQPDQVRHISSKQLRPCQTGYVKFEDFTKMNHRVNGVSLLVLFPTTGL